MYINGYYFEEKYISDYEDKEMLMYSAAGKSLYDYYKNPSQAKQYIYKWWKNFINKSKYLYNMGVYYGNCFSFGIMAEYYDSEKHVFGIIQITKDHDRIYFPKGFQFCKDDKNDEC